MNTKTLILPSIDEVREKVQSGTFPSPKQFDHHITDLLLHATMLSRVLSSCGPDDKTIELYGRYADALEKHYVSC